MIRARWHGVIFIWPEFMTFSRIAQRHWNIIGPHWQQAILLLIPGPLQNKAWLRPMLPQGHTNEQLSATGAGFCWLNS